MGNKAGKIWGQTELILANSSANLQNRSLKGVCSKHKHEWKWNGFHVVLHGDENPVWQKDYDLVDETIL